MIQLTDQQLKQALAKMLPELVRYEPEREKYDLPVYWFKEKYSWRPLLDTELLHLCWLVEEKIYSPKHRPICWQDYQNHLASETSDLKSISAMLHASWQQRVIALAKVKGIEIV